MKENSKDTGNSYEKRGVNDQMIPSHIVRAFTQGDHAAFEKIFHFHYSRVKSFIQNLTKEHEMAEDLSQQVFVDLWINREKVDPDKNMSSYIYAMAKNSTFTALKRQLRFETSEFDDREEEDSAQTDDELIVRETELLINLTVAAMPPKRRQVYEMSRIQHKSNEEIEKELKISRKVVEKHLRLAINELRNVLEKNE